MKLLKRFCGPFAGLFAVGALSCATFAEGQKAPELKAAPAPAARPVAVPKPVPAKQNGARQFTITVAGDTGFSPHAAPVNPSTSSKGGRTLTFEQAFAPMSKDVNGDLNMINVETIVTDRNDLATDSKGQGNPFHFRSHPNGFAHLVRRGVNLFSLANNHSMDFGEAGLRETLKHVGAMSKIGLKAYAGIGLNRDEASRTHLVVANGATVAFSAMGIVTNNLERHRAGPDKPGQIAYRFPEDMELSVDRLLEPKADYRMLSIHYGVEGYVRADSEQTTNWRKMAENGVDLVVGHHAHVVRGVEMTANGGVIFYGLGNFMHHGTANISGNPVCRSYGLFARVHVGEGADGRWHMRAVEAIPVTDTYLSPHRYGSVGDSHYRIYALNYLGETLDDSSGARGMRFTPQADGSGLYCVDGAAGDGGRIGALCKAWQPAPPIPANLRGGIAASCAR